jgi:amino acid adenylation domain-containing protein
MSGVAELLSDLRSREIRLWCEQESLRFEAPPGALTPELRELLRRRKPEILDFLRRTAKPAAARLPAIGRAAGAAAATVSFQQERLWFLAHLLPDSSAYNIPAAVRLDGELDRAALAGALRGVARRHSALRSVFPDAGARPGLRLLGEESFRLPVVDLAALRQVDRDRESGRLAAAEAVRPFDLARGPLCRAALVACGPAAHLLLLTQHHIVSDRWSTAVLLGELGRLYGAAAGHGGAALPALPVQYADYAAWQRQCMASGALDGQLAYWRGRLGGELPVLELPMAAPRPAAPLRRGGGRSFALDAGLALAARRLGGRLGATPFMLLLSVFAALLGRYGEQEDLLVGTPTANRGAPETAGLIGFFANLMALRIDLAGGPSLRQLVERVRRVAVGAYDHQDLPFEKLVEEINPQRDLARNPLFQVAFLLETEAAPALRLAGVRATVLPAPPLSPKFDLLLALQQEEDGLRGWIEYSAELFRPDAVIRLTRHFATLLRGALAAPDVAVGELALLGEEERHQVLDGWNDGAAAFSAGACLHDLVAAQAARTPDAAAASCRRQTLSYGELDRAAGRLARRLAARGVGVGEKVGICCVRSLAMVVGLLGILKAGAAYVPLDPAYPAARRRAILDGTGCELVLTSGGAFTGWPGGPAVLDVAAAAAPGDGLAGPPLPRCPPEALAYVIFTSGSTGGPKGVVLQHRPVVNLVEWVNRSFGVGPGDRLLFITSLAFDLSVYDVFGTLAAGAEVVIAAEEELAEPAALAALLAGGAITFWDSAPAALQQLVPCFPHAAGDGAALRLVFLSGDWVPLSLAPAVTERFANARVVALGGATEAAIWSNFFPVRAIDPRWRSVPYGRPIQNARYHVLDERLGLLPIEVPGDLYIGGGCLSAGYDRQPELTAERYLPDPFSREPGAVLYRTGDRARHLADGNLEFLGRRDSQVKIRGYRIELGEVEAALRRQPQVLEAVALVREDRPGDRRLVAYVRLAAAATPAPAGGGELAPAPAGGGELAPALAEEITTALRALLPEYMMPAALVAVAAWPVTANGKLDRRALPGPALAAEAGAAEPATPLAAALADIWREVLGVGAVGAGDNFFQLGGHSLLAIQAVAAIRDRLAVEVPLQQLFAAPTPAELAAWITATGGARGGAPAIETVSRQGTLPLSFAQERMWFIDQLEPGSAAYVIAAAMRLTGGLDRRALRGALQRIVDRHEVLRACFAVRLGLPALAVAARLRLPLPVVDLAALAAAGREAETRRLAAADALRPFDLARPPLLRVTLLALAPRRHVLLLAIHHIVADAWSVGVMLRELTAHYTRLRGGAAPPLPELPVQYLDYAAWQRRRLGGAELDRQLAYWRRQLAGVPPALELPADRPRPAAFRFRGGTAGFVVPAFTLSAIDALRERAGATRFMVLLAAFQVLLARYTGQLDVVVGAPVANRDRSELQDLVGLFVNTLVLRTDLGGEPSFRDLLGRTRATVLAAFEHQDLPFEKLVEELNPGRDVSRNPLVQVVLTVDSALAGDRQLPDLEAAVLPLDNLTAKFDLHLDLGERGGALHGRIEYDADIFVRATLQRLGGHLAVLLDAIATDPGRRIGELPLLAAAEAWQLTGEWNDTGAARREPPTLHAMFERRAAAAPDRLAAACGGAQLSYGELERQANRTAHLLMARGAGPGERIAICCRRSLAMLVGLLAILKTGAAYVPIEAAHPGERIRHVLGETGARLLVTQSELLGALAGPAGDPGPRVAAVCLDREPLAGLPATAPAPRAGGQDLAYVIFTSGSTGRPKGVMVQHRPAVNVLDWVNGRFDVGAGDRLLFVTSLCFDLSVYDVFGLLAAGGVVEVATEAELDDPPALAARLDGGGVTIWDSAPAALQRLLPFLPPPGAGSRSLRLALLSGDWIPLSLLPPVTASFPALRVVSLGGATEATIWSNAFPIGEIQPEWRSVPYGRPLRGARYLVLDAGLAPCPIGVPGALYIGGEVLSLGYCRQPGLTAGRYLPDPYGPPGGVLYATGDRARWLADQNLEFLGRLDDQVKIRGYRVEPGEVAAVLREHPEVREAVVMAVAGRLGDRQLAAWVEPLPGGALGCLRPDALAGALREFLGERLPEYLVPALFARVESWPVSANGKLDRGALPQTGMAAGFGEARETAAPRHPVEELVAGVWCELLALPEVGVHDNFFDLGGHSILLAQLASRLRQVLGVEVPLRRLFEGATVAEQAVMLAAHPPGAAGAAPRPPLTPLADRSMAPLSFAQERLWIEHQRHPESAAYNVPFAFHLRGRLRPAALAHAVERLAARHETLRTTFSLPPDRPMARVGAPRPVPLPLVDLSGIASAGARQAAARRLADAEALAPFDLARGPLLRVRLVRLAPEHHLAIFNLHHIVFDGWSIGVLLGELGAFYEAAGGGGAPPPPALALQYADFAAWQRSRMQGGALTAALAAWRRHLAGAPAALELPGRRPRPAVLGDRGASLPLALGAAATAALRALGRRQGATLFMVLMAGFDVLLRHHTGAEDLVVGTDVAGREDPELAGLVGFFVNQVAVRASLAGAPSFDAVLARVRQALLEVYSLQETPFNMVVEALNPPRDPSRTPLFQVKIGLQAPPAGAMTLPGLALAEYRIGGETSKLDLWLNLWEQGEGLAGRLEYNRDAVRRETAMRFAGQYEGLLAALPANSGLDLAALDLLVEGLAAPAVSTGLAAARASVFARRLEAPVQR